MVVDGIWLVLLCFALCLSCDNSGIIGLLVIVVQWNIICIIKLTVMEQSVVEFLQYLGHFLKQI